jgi:hypothetical protein
VEHRRPLGYSNQAVFEVIMEPPASIHLKNNLLIHIASNPRPLGQVVKLLEKHI